MPTTPILPPGFTMQGEYIVSPAFGSFMRVWTTGNFDMNRRLSPGERRKVAQMGGNAYLTVKGGRPGWNVRASFLKTEADRGLIFVMVADGVATMFSHRGSTVRRAVTA